MSFIANLFRSPRASTPPAVSTPSVSATPSVGTAGSDTGTTKAITKTKRGARLALFATQGGSFGVQGRTPTARRKLLGN